MDRALTVGVALLALVSFATSDSMDRFCVGVSNGVFVSNPRSCQHWIFCQNSVAVEGSCTGIFYFDETLQMCRYPDYVNCRVDPVDVACSSRELEFHPHPDSCTEYVVCVNGFPQVHECAPGLNWDQGRQLCDVPANTDCQIQPEFDYTCEPGATYVRYHPHDCQKFIICTNGQLILRRCSTDLLFDPSNLRCDFEQNVSCNLAEENVDYVCDPLVDFYLAPHPTNCSYFIRCIQGQRQIERCAPGLHFDFLARQCNVIGIATCLPSTDQ